MTRNVVVTSLSADESRAYKAECKKYRHPAQAARAIFARGLSYGKRRSSPSSWRGPVSACEEERGGQAL